MPLWLRKMLKRRARCGWFAHLAMVNLDYAGVAHPDSPQRLIALEAELRRQKIWQRLMKREAAVATDKDFALVHSRHYLNRLESLQPQAGKIVRLDDDTVLTQNSFEITRLAAGSVIRAVDYVLAGKAYHAFCATRPPGHHARSNASGSFCVINNVAVGAMHALYRCRLKKIAILDFDVHRGNGTEEIFSNENSVLYLGISQNGLYPFDNMPSESCADNLHNFALPADCNSLTFRQIIRENWLPKLKAFAPELILLSAGFDAHREDTISDTQLHEADYAWLTHKIIETATSCKGKIVSVLEGGYQPESLAKSAAAHLYVLAGMGKPACAIEYDKYLRQLAKNT